MLTRVSLTAALVLLANLHALAQPADPATLFARDNLVAWCIVPFDAKQRGPEARAEMLANMGIKKFAYDWRAEHIPTFDAEIAAMRAKGIEITAWWFPAGLNDEAKAILDALKRNDLKTQLWVSMHGGEVQCTPEEHAQLVTNHVNALRPICEAAAAQGCTVGLYNHGGWFGEPENQIEILKALNVPNAGIVYNQHHGHAHIDRFPALLEKMKPYLYCLNLNGMEPKGDEIGKKIWPLGSGSLDLKHLQDIVASGYAGPIGILGHTMDDAEPTLLDNLDGLDWLVAQLQGKEAGARPALRIPRAEPQQPQAQAQAPVAPHIIEVKKLWDAAPHNAFTDLCRFQQQWYCTFREGEGHVGGDGKIRILRSADGAAWESAALLEEQGIDLRDPKVSVTPDGRLMMICGGSVYNGGTTLLGMQPRVAFSNDGSAWTPTQRIMNEGEWLWRVTWHDGIAYGITYGASTRIVKSRDGIHYEDLANVDVPGDPSEATIRFLQDGTCLALVRRDTPDPEGYVGTSTPPFTDWTWSELNLRVGGQDFVQLPNGSLWTGTRHYVDPVSTVVAKLTPQEVTPVLTLPSGGDTSYPGMVWYDGELWMSYYASHEGKSAIYLARIGGLM